MSRAIGLLLGFVADRIFGDPRRCHPVAGFGRLAAALEARWYADSRLRGVLHVGVLVGGVGVTAYAVTSSPFVRCNSLTVAETDWKSRLIRHLPPALVTYVVLGGRSLDREAAAVQRLLEEGRLADARQRLTHLVGRDTADLDEAGIARAVIESVAENTSDAVVAPLVWGALLGPAGLLGYRAANTLDAMIGHHGDRYERFGWAAARLDDLLNLPGSRLTAALAVLLGADRPGAIGAWRRDARAHPSPNAGPVEAAFAGALGVQVGGTTVYRGRVEERPRLGDGRAPEAHDILRARRLAARVQSAALIGCLPIAVATTRGRRRRR